MERDELLRALCKRLVWEQSIAGRWIGTPPVKLGDLAFWIFMRHNGYIRHVVNQGTLVYPSLAAAKAAAEADYRARIAEAIRLDLITGLVEALEDVHRHCQNSGIEIATVGERVVERCEETALLALSAFRAAGGEV
jgi:hypothetical protein